MERLLNQFEEPSFFGRQTALMQFQFRGNDPTDDPERRRNIVDPLASKVSGGNRTLIDCSIMSLSDSGADCWSSVDGRVDGGGP